MLSQCLPKRVSDHPRVCGEREFLEQFGREKVGSSPRVRGTLR